MNILRDNLKQDIRELLERYNRQTLTISDINIRLPETLTAISCLLENPDFSISNSISQKKYLVIENGTKHYCTEIEVAEFRKKNATMLLDMPNLSLKVCIEDNSREFDFEKLPSPIQKILELGMSQPGELLNQDNSRSRETLKRYIFETRKLLADNEWMNFIKTSKKKTLPNGNYYFNPRLSYVVIKNSQSTCNPPSINKSIYNKWNKELKK